MSQSYELWLESFGFNLKSTVVAGEWIRGGKKGELAAKSFEDGLGGVLKNWRTGEVHYWFSSDQQNLSPVEQEKRKQDAATLKRAREFAQNLLYADVAKKAKMLFDGAPRASEDHPYLVRKRVKPYGIKQVNGNLLIPVYSPLGLIQSIQFIDEAGVKKFMKGGKMLGGRHFIGEFASDKPIYVAEGYSTAASVYEDVQCLTVIAFNAGNLLNVATDLRKQLTDIEIVITGDSDVTGQKYADIAAQAVNGTTLIPDFGNNPYGYTDWNEYLNFMVTA